MALRISRRVCTLGRPRALGAGTKGSMWNHSASDKSVWYALLMLGTLPSPYLRTPFRTVSEGVFSETGLQAYEVPESSSALASFLLRKGRLDSIGLHGLSLLG